MAKLLYITIYKQKANSINLLLALILSNAYLSFSSKEFKVSSTLTP